MTPTRTAWLVVLLLCPVALLNYLDRQMLAAMKFSVMGDIPTIVTEANWGRMLGQFKWVYAFLSPVGGYLADRYSRRAVICGSLFVWSAVTWATGHVTTYDGLLVTRSLMGISEAFYIPAALALIADYHLGPTRSRAVGMHQMAIYCGVIVGGFSGYVADSPGLGWRWAFDACGLFGMAYALPLTLLLRDAPDRSAAALDRSVAAAAPAPSAARSARELLTNGSFVLLVLYFTLPALAGWVVRDWMPAILKQQFGISQGLAGVSATLYWQAAAIVGALAGGFLADRWMRRSERGRIFTSAIGMSLIVPAIAGVGHAGTLAVAVAFLVLFGLGWGFFDCNNMPILCQVVRPDLRATGYGIMNLVSISCGGVADWGFGALRDARVPLDAIFGLFAGAAVLSVVLVLLIRPRYGQERSLGSRADGAPSGASWPTRERWRSRRRSSARSRSSTGSALEALVTGGDIVADVLARQGVRFLFTLCGGHISPILVSAKARGIRVVDTRHEATAVFAADAVARLTGVPGVAAVTAGPGVTNAITALKNAQMAQSPVVLLGGAAATLLRGRGALQDIDQMALVRPHVKQARRLARVRDLAPVLDEAFRLSREGVPGPVFLECPVDLLYPEALVREWYAAKAGKESRTLGERARRWYVGRHLDRLFGGVEAPTTTPFAVPAPAPEETDVRRAAVLLSRAERPALLVGSQALLSVAEADALAEAVRALGVPVYLSGMARGLLGAADPLQMRHGRKEALREADLVILAGAPCDFRLDYGSHVGRRAVLVSANRSRAETAMNRRPTLPVPGAPELFLRGLARTAAGPHPGWDAWKEELRARDAARDAEIAGQAGADAPGGLNPLRVLRALDETLVDDSVIVADGGDFVATASYVLRPRRPLSWLDPGPFGTLGVGAGFALGAKLVRPSADVWIVYGDGALGYSLAEADTFVRHGLGVVALVGNDAGWTQIAREQVEVLMDDVGTALAPTDYERAAEGLGARGLRLDSADEIAPVLREAAATARSGRPVYVNARIGRTDFRKGSISM